MIQSTSSTPTELRIKVSRQVPYREIQGTPEIIKTLQRRFSINLKGSERTNLEVLWKQQLWRIANSSKFFHFSTLPVPFHFNCNKDTLLDDWKARSRHPIKRAKFPPFFPIVYIVLRPLAFRAFRILFLSLPCNIFQFLLYSIGFYCSYFTFFPPAACIIHHYQLFVQVYPILSISRAGGGGGAITGARCRKLPNFSEISGLPLQRYRPCNLITLSGFILCQSLPSVLHYVYKCFKLYPFVLRNFTRCVLVNNPREAQIAGKQMPARKTFLPKSLDHFSTSSYPSFSRNKRNLLSNNDPLICAFWP